MLGSSQKASLFIALLIYRLTPGEALIHPFLFPKSFDPYMSFLGRRLEEEKQEMLIEWDSAKTTMVQGWDAERGILVDCNGHVTANFFSRKTKWWKSMNK